MLGPIDITIHDVEIIRVRDTRHPTYKVMEIICESGEVFRFNIHSKDDGITVVDISGYTQ